MITSYISLPGRSDANDWISKYVVMYGNDGVHFGKVLAGDAKPKVGTVPLLTN